MESKSKQCKVVMITTNGSTMGCLAGYSNWSLLFDFKESYGNTIQLDEVSTFHLYIISDEEIKEGDYVIDYLNDLYGPYTNGDIIKTEFTKAYKVIATTDTSLNFPKTKKSFISKYISEYNKYNIITDVMVEYNNNLLDIAGTGKTILKQYVNINSHNEITIRRVKDSWTEEEVHQYMQYYMEYCKANGYITPIEWIATKKH